MPKIIPNKTRWQQIKKDCLVEAGLKGLTTKVDMGKEFDIFHSAKKDTYQDLMAAYETLAKKFDLYITAVNNEKNDQIIKKRKQFVEELNQIKELIEAHGITSNDSAEYWLKDINNFKIICGFAEAVKHHYLEPLQFISAAKEVQQAMTYENVKSLIVNYASVTTPALYRLKLDNLTSTGNLEGSDFEKEVDSKLIDKIIEIVLSDVRQGLFNDFKEKKLNTDITKAKF